MKCWFLILSMRLTIILSNVIALLLFTNEGDVMNKQIVAIFLTLLMIGTIFVIAPSDLQVDASGGGGDNGFELNESYIREKTAYRVYVEFLDPDGNVLSVGGMKENLLRAWYVFTVTYD